jgi:hypothetical protein
MTQDRLGDLKLRNDSNGSLGGRALIPRKGSLKEAVELCCLCVFVVHLQLNKKGQGRVYTNVTRKLISVFLRVYYESIKREPKIRGIKKCRCDERLQTKTKQFTRLPYTGLVLELEHLKIETRLISERFANAMGECEN